MGVLNEMRDEAHEIAVQSGWHSPAHGTRTVGDLIALMHSELSEALEAYRDGHPTDETYYAVKQGGVSEIGVVPASRAYRHPDHGVVIPVKDHRGARTTLTAREALDHGIRIKPEGVPSELVDVIIRILDFAGVHGIDLDTAFEEKMTYNAQREYRHGGKTL